ncbi:PREDICTED: vomeronasal type-1 receptor 4-like [Galeopterus variegatus]|uniref:Vomeronasal type-1 receptor n=1 Tax=Galeopterus variegatus TaxID=482537 RepID=A0ABM0S0T9_GALVR|nr:PREDICTED: vomeronasal type-1 receptor 4-like [Galeopterus variegatus]
MATRNVAVGTIVLLQSVFGILGNSFLLYHYLFLYFTGCRLRTTDLIVENLLIANILVILSRGIPHAMISFGWQHVLSDHECKFISYVHRVGRGASIGSTCLLSVFQAIMISLRNSRWAELKIKASRFIGPSIFLCWTLQMLLNVIFPMYVTGKLSNKNITNMKDFQYCSSVRHDKTEDWLYAALLSFPDVLYLGLMLWASSSMVLVLYRHKQQMRHIHRNNISPLSSPESRATKTILLLMSTFVFFYTLACIFQGCLAIINKPSWFLMNSTSIIAGCFSTISPFLLLSCDSSAFTLCFSRISHRESLND